MLRILVAPMTLLFMFGATTAFSFDGGFGEGDLELNARFGFSQNHLSVDTGENDTSNDFDLATFIGVFVSDRIQVGGTIFAQFSTEEIVGGLSSGGTMIGIGPDIVFNYNTSGSIVPYVDIGIAVALGSGDGSGDEIVWIAPSVRGGARALVGDSISANFGIGFAHMSNTYGVTGVSNYSFSAFVGVSFFK
jgi:hypothetical protein